MKRLLVAFSAVVLLAATGPSMQQMAPYLHAQRLVDIGGRRMNIYCTGSGSPTVIMDAGLGGSTEVWYKVQRPIAQHTRVCSYDRAGMGFSDGATTKRDPSAVVSDLHALLRRAGIQPPYILVGHSIAGLYEPLYADRYPNEVAGMVLVDPSRPFQVQRFAAVAPSIAKLMESQLQEVAGCYARLSHGRTPAALRYCGYPTDAQERAACKKMSPAGCAYDKVQNAQWLNPLSWYDDESEIRSLVDGTAGSLEVQRAQRYYGDMPLIVLTADDGPQHVTGMPASVPKSQAAAQWKIWKSMHDKLATYSSVGVNFVVRNTGHYIQWDQPAVVISSVDEVVDQARARAR